MQFWVDIESPTTMHMRVRWPSFAPVPAIGDTALVRAGDVTWVFKVLDRSIGIGSDPTTLQPAAHALLRVDAEAPAGWDPARLL